MNRKQTSQLTTGMLLVAIGLVLLSSELHLGWARGVWRYWPVLFLVLGVGRLLGAPEDGRWGSGVWFLFLGAIFFLHTFHVLSLHDSWPLFIVAAGASMLFGRSESDSAAPKQPAGNGPEGRR